MLPVDTPWWLYLPCGCTVVLCGRLEGVAGLALPFSLVYNNQSFCAGVMTCPLSFIGRVRPPCGPPLTITWILIVVLCICLLEAMFLPLEGESCVPLPAGWICASLAPSGGSGLCDAACVRLHAFLWNERTSSCRLPGE